jgi:dihydrofolate synthase/folylpolyglutamate synthase
LWLDGGHNPGAGAVLADAAAGWRDRPLYLVVGMLNGKDASGFLMPLAEHAKALRAITIPREENPLPARAIAAAARKVGLPAQDAASVLAAVCDLAKPPETGRILICGSLHLAGIVLAENG